MSKGPILILEDNEDDAFLLKRAIHKSRIESPIIILPDGQEGIDYLVGVGKYQNRDQYPLPRVLIVDIKMPRVNGLQFLSWLKAHPEHQVIPTLVLSSSKHETDIASAYKSGINSYMVKPTTFEDLQEMVKIIHEYWTHCVVPSEKWS